MDVPGIADLLGAGSGDTGGAASSGRLRVVRVFGLVVMRDFEVDALLTDASSDNPDVPPLEPRQQLKRGVVVHHRELSHRNATASEVRDRPPIIKLRNQVTRRGENRRAAELAGTGEADADDRPFASL